MRQNDTTARTSSNLNQEKLLAGALSAASNVDGITAAPPEAEPLPLPTVFDTASRLSRTSAPPSDLNTSQADYWREIVGESPDNFFALTDKPILRQYCKVLVKLDELNEQMPNEEVTTSSARGTDIANPFWTVYANISYLAANLSQRLRMNPAARKLEERAKKTEDKIKEKKAEEQSAKQADEEKKSQKKTFDGRQHLMFGGSKARPQ